MRVGGGDIGVGGMGGALVCWMAVVEWVLVVKEVK
jgi:hypothetical protein